MKQIVKHKRYVGFIDRKGEIWIVVYRPNKTRAAKVEDAIWRQYECKGSRLPLGAVHRMIERYREVEGQHGTR